jgi:hypothetical protein
MVRQANELKQQEDTVDPITAINLEFVREVKEDWTREPAAYPTKQAPHTRRAGLVDRLRTLFGAGLIAAAAWLNTPAQPIHVDK